MKFNIADTADRAALLRVNLTYLWRHGRLPNLDSPTRFTELVQLRKLHDRDMRMPTMADKLAIKSIVAGRLGPEWVIPALWSGVNLPDRPHWDQPIILKSRHGCNQNLILHDGKSDWVAARKLSNRWIESAYGRWLDEWLYTQIPRGLLIEPYIGVGAELPVDYKIYVFHGQATHVQAHLERATNHRWIVHDTDWRALTPGENVKRPSALSAMLDAAEEMARDFSFARVDFYQPGDRPLFGEMTFYPGSGLDPFYPPALDEAMGEMWLRSETEAPMQTFAETQSELVIAA